MGLRFRKSIKSGPFKLNLSKSGIGWSVGGKGYRFTKKASGGTQRTYSIPGSGLNYTQSSKKHTIQTPNKSTPANAATPITVQQNRTPAENSSLMQSPQPVSSVKTPFYNTNWFFIISIIFLPPLGIFLLWKNKKSMSKVVKILVTVALSFWSIILLASMGETEEETSEQTKTVPSTVYTTTQTTVSRNEQLLPFISDSETVSQSTSEATTTTEFESSDTSESANSIDKEIENTEAGSTIENTTEKQSTKKTTDKKTTKSTKKTSKTTKKTSTKKTTKKTSSGNRVGSTVWITKTGKCYHSIPNCGSTKKSWKISLAEAKKKGLKPCTKCC